LIIDNFAGRAINDLFPRDFERSAAGSDTNIVPYVPRAIGLAPDVIRRLYRRNNQFAIVECVMFPVGYSALSPKGDNGRRRRLKTGETASAPSR
jgi:hypothetical protein